MSSSLLRLVVRATHDLGRGLVQLVFPGCCYLCNQPVPTGQVSICTDCQSALLKDSAGACPQCAAVIGPFALTEGGCIHCRDEKFAFRAAVRLGTYEGKLRELVLRLKNAHSEVLAELIGELWADRDRTRFEELRLDAVVPVPLHWRRFWQRGYNQSQAIARGLAQRLGLPCQTRWLRRVRHTPPQTSQSRSGRRDNVRGAFAVRSAAPVSGQSILLVDDVMTTGSTASEAARALIRSGANRVVLAALARAGL